MRALEEDRWPWSACSQNQPYFADNPFALGLCGFKPLEWASQILTCRILTLTAGGERRSATLRTARAEEPSSADRATRARSLKKAMWR
jgi:hypothetical protein